MSAPYDVVVEGAGILGTSTAIIRQHDSTLLLARVPFTPLVAASFSDTVRTWIAGGAGCRRMNATNLLS